MAAPKVGGRSPWGRIQGVEVLVPGLMWRVDTPGHGGIKLSPALQKRVPAFMQAKGSWYEEDVRWAIPYFLFMKEADPKRHAIAVRTMKEYMPDDYRQLTGEEVSAADSHVIRSRMFASRNRYRWVVIAAFGSWKPGVPRGKVGVVATLGGRRERERGDEKWFLVDEARYKAVDNQPYVIDPGKDIEIAPLR